ncbi:MAG: sugar ABC transporter permease [Clostridia bacterium]|nr:sugar ABC transporter permease [Clostridia bacterium]
MSFNKIHILAGGGYTLEWVGFENYSEALFTDTGFIPSLISGLKNLAFDIPAILLFSLFMAVLLNQKMVGRAAFRAIFFIPVILSTGIMESIEASNILSTYMESSSGIDTGEGTSAAAEIVSAVDVQYLFSSMKVGAELATYVSTMVNNIFDIVNRSGVQMLIFLSGLQSISPAIYESCKMDGATAWETFWKITFPMISPMILVNAVYTVIDSFTTSKNVVMAYIDTVYEKTDGQVISSAMSWMYFLLIFLIVGVIAGIVSAFVFYQRKND